MTSTLTSLEISLHTNMMSWSPDWRIWLQAMDRALFSTPSRGQRVWTSPASHKELLGHSRMGKGMVFPLWTFPLGNDSLFLEGILTFFPHKKRELCQEGINRPSVHLLVLWRYFGGKRKQLESDCNPHNTRCHFLFWRVTTASVCKWVWTYPDARSLDSSRMWRIVPNGFIILKNSIDVFKSCGIKPAEVCNQIQPYLIFDQC